jgi:hypothetical protein
MKQILVPAAFNPAAKTVDFSNVAGFVPGRLLAIVNATSRATLYDPITARLGLASVSGSVVTLQFNTTAQAPTDTILAFYDDGVSPATAAAQASILAALGTPLQAGGTVNDAQSAPCPGVVAMTVGTTYAAQRQLGVLCTTAGNVSMTFIDGSTLVLPVYVGWQTFFYCVTTINASGTTATAAYYNLK